MEYDWHWDFNTGNGDIANQGVHQIDIARWFLGEQAPPPRAISIGCRAGYDDAGNTPNTQVAYFDYEKAPLVFEVRGLPRNKAAQKQWGSSMDTYRGMPMGVTVQCEQGYVTVNSGAVVKAYDGDGKLAEQWTGMGNHCANFLEAVRSRKTEDQNADILEGHLSTSLCHTANISQRMGKDYAAEEIAERLDSPRLLAESFARMADHLLANEVDIERDAISLGPWLKLDPESERFTNHEAANRLLRSEDRPPFVVPEIEV